MIEALAGRFDQAALLLKRSLSLTPRCPREECLDTAEVLLLDGSLELGRGGLEGGGLDDGGTAA